MTACKGGGEVPLAHLQLGGEAVGEVGLHGTEYHAVIAVYLAVVVGIDELGISCLGGESVDGGELADIFALLHDACELQAVEGAECLALAEYLLAVSTLKHVVGLAHVGDFVVIVGYVGRGCPQQVATLEQGAVHGEFDALVLHVAHVLQLAGHAIGKAHRHVKQEVGGLLVIEVKYEVEATIVEVSHFRLSLAVFFFA